MDDMERDAQLLLQGAGKSGKFQKVSFVFIIGYSFIMFYNVTSLPLQKIRPEALCRYKDEPFDNFKPCDHETFCNNNYEKGIDMTRYAIQNPNPSLVNDVQYCRKLCNNIKIQHEYFNNRLENLTMMSDKDNLSTVWLENNEYIQGSNELIINKINGIKRKINEVNSERYNYQSRSFDEIQRLHIKKAQSIQRIQLLTSYLEENSRTVKNL
jgi:hypothetical protein